MHLLIVYRLTCIDLKKYYKIAIFIYRRKLFVSDHLRNAVIDQLVPMSNTDRRDYEYLKYLLSDEESPSQDKRAPKGFMGMRGKKISHGFYGLRGKKDSYKSSDEVKQDNTHTKRKLLKTKSSLQSKRNIFRKNDLTQAKRDFSDFMGEKRRIIDVYGVRGKRELHNVWRNQKKSTLTKYFGMKGGKLVSFKFPKFVLNNIHIEYILYIRIYCMHVIKYMSYILKKKIIYKVNI